MSTTISASSVLGSVRIFGRKPKTYDLLAASPLVIWYIIGLSYQSGSIAHDIVQMNLASIAPLATIDLLSRLTRFLFAVLLTALMVVRRTPIKKQRSISKRVIAFFGCYVGIGAQILPTSISTPFVTVLSAFLIIFGMAFAIYSLLWLGRSISIMPESRTLVTGGPYSFVRHPLYVGEQIAVVGVALQCSSVWVLAVLMLQFCCQLYRMIYEEEILADTFPEYKAYAERTARLIPWLY